MKRELKYQNASEYTMETARVADSWPQPWAHPRPSSSGALARCMVCRRLRLQWGLWEGPHQQVPGVSPHVTSVGCSGWGPYAASSPGGAEGVRAPHRGPGEGPAVSVLA